ncbi:aromatic prenyltransferase [Penicillium herquei]|nr:aromatic prenyltransferase [Penicillium herquei]
MTHSKNFSTEACVMPTWEVTSKWLSTTAASQPWWELVGAQLTMLAHNAQYSPEKQLEVILFFYTQVVPSLGKLQTPADPGWETRWRSLLTNDGSPVEHSWKWNADGSHGPEVRYCIEAIGPQTGTSSDPYNYLATKALVEQLVPLLPAMDLTWFYKLADTLQISRCQPATENPEAPPSSTFIAFEHVAEGIVPKVYFLPTCDPESQGPPTFTTFGNAIRAAVGEKIEAADAVFEYVSNDPIGRTMSPDMLAIDCVDPAKSRLKLYASSSEASLESIVSIMSLGQRIQNIGKGVGVKAHRTLLELTLASNRLLTSHSLIRLIYTADLLITSTSRPGPLSPL